MSTSKKSVLVTEDNPGLAKVLTFKFKSSGFDVVSCANGGDALKAFVNQPTDVVVTDHEMPVLSGIELIERIRELSPNTPCFLVTGRQLELSRDPRVVKLGVKEVFGKPFSPGKVVSTVNSAIEESAGQADSQANTDANPPIAVPNLIRSPAPGVPEATQ